MSDVSSAGSSDNSYCFIPEVPEREFTPDVTLERAHLIRTTGLKWVNGTVLHYYFFDQPTDSLMGIPWTTGEAEKDVVRNAFKAWEDVKMGVKFEEVNSRQEAEVRIGFMRRDGAWSYVGREILSRGPDERTMNFGWDLTRHPREIDTAVHEIGHTLGFPHEHQNPNAGIVWDEEAVYEALAGPPNNWPRQKTFHNIIRKIDPDTVQGSRWDPNSIMHYPFEEGLIDKPEEYRLGLTPEPGLSEQDVAWVRAYYPPLAPSDYELLQPLDSIRLAVLPGQQRNFVIEPEVSRTYSIATFGVSDTVIVLFEELGGEPRYVAGDDDSGEEFNANLNVRLQRGHRYFLRVRLYYSFRSGETAVMIW
jgi:hypothetical protein